MATHAVKIVEENVLNSFRLAKSDMIQLNNCINVLHNHIVELTKELNDVKQQQWQHYTAISGIVQEIQKRKDSPKQLTYNSRKQKEYVASKKNEKFHERNCPFAKNISGKNKVFFKTKMSAYKQGFNSCACVK